MLNNLREWLWNLWGAFQWYYRWWMGVLAAVVLAAAIGAWLHFAALQRTRVRQMAELSAADSLIMAGATERAGALLDSLSPHLAEAAPNVAMRHAVLLVKARDKAYLPLPPPDSLVSDFVHHYDRHPDLPPAHRAEAYYYAGRTFSELGDAPQALGFFQRALDVLGPDDVSLLHERTHFQMSELFALRIMDDLAIVHERQALRLAQLLGDTASVICAYWDLAEAFNNHDADSVRHYHSLALRAAREVGDSASYRSALRSMASIALFWGRMEEAEECLQPCLRAWHDGLEMEPPVLSIAAKYYFQIGDMEQADRYARLALAHCNLYGRQNAERILYRIAQDAGHLAEAAAHFEAYVALSDSVARRDDRAMLRRMQAAYDYTQREQSIRRLEAKNERSRRRGATALLVLCFVLLSVSVAVLWLRLRVRNAEALRQRAEQAYDVARRTSNESIARLEETVRTRQAELEKLTRERDRCLARIDTLSSRHSHDLRQLETTQAQVETMWQQSETQQQELTLLRNELDARRADRLLRSAARTREKEAFASSPLRQELTGRSQQMTQREDRAIQEFFRQHNPAFLQKLQALAVVSTDEWRISVLLRLGLPHKNIGILLDKKPGSIHYFRQKLAAKWLADKLSKPKAEDWDLYIDEL